MAPRDAVAELLEAVARRWPVAHDFEDHALGQSRPRSKPAFLQGCSAKRGKQRLARRAVASTRCTGLLPRARPQAAAEAWSPLIELALRQFSALFFVSNLHMGKRLVIYSSAGHAEAPPVYRSSIGRSCSRENHLSSIS